MKPGVETVKLSVIRGRIRTMSEHTITDFLEARIAEDEAVATLESEAYQERMLAECAAKRAILGDYLREYRMRADMDRHNTNPAIYYGLPSDKVLRQITSVYADHPDYQQEWAL